MRLYTVLFALICLIAAGVYQLGAMRYRMEKIEAGNQSDAKRIAVELDNRLGKIRSLENDIAGITWVKRLATSSDVFLKDFTAVERIEYQNELARYFSIDDAIQDIGIYLADRQMVLCQKGWFTAEEYRSYLRRRCDIDAQEIYGAAAVNNNSDAFLYADMNLKGGKNLVLVKSLINVSSPQASLIVILDRRTFCREIEKLSGGAVLGITVRNLTGRVLFQTADEEPKGYAVTVASREVAASYQMVYPEPAETLRQYGAVEPGFFWVLALLLAIAVGAAFGLSLYNTRPLRQLAESVSGLTGEAETEDADFDEIVDSVTKLCAQKQDLQVSAHENYNLTRRYALMLALLGDGKFREWEGRLESLGIPFTEEQRYAVLLLTQKQEQPETVDWAALAMEVLPEAVSAEELSVSAVQSVLILGFSEAPEGLSVAAERIGQLALERFGVLAELQTGTCGGPGIGGIAKSYRSLTASSGKEPGSGKAGQEMAVYIRENYCSPDLSLKDLAGRWNLSVPTVSRVCKEALGKSFQDYLTELRLEKAKELLRQGKSAAVVAEEVGYGSEYSFRRAFGRSENCRLQDWREGNV